MQHSTMSGILNHTSLQKDGLNLSILRVRKSLKNGMFYLEMYKGVYTVPWFLGLNCNHPPDL